MITVVSNERQASFSACLLHLPPSPSVSFSTCHLLCLPPSPPASFLGLGFVVVFKVGEVCVFGDGLSQVGVGCTPTVSWLVAKWALEGGGGGEAMCPRCVFPIVLCLCAFFVLWLVNLRMFGSFCGISGDVVEA